jgi:hypothetical protein
MSISWAANHFLWPLIVESEEGQGRGPIAQHRLSWLVGLFDHAVCCQGQKHQRAVTLAVLFALSYCV